MTSVAIKRKTARYDLSEFGVSYPDSNWLMRYEVAEGSTEVVRFDFETLPAGWREAIRSYLACTLLGLSKRPTTVVLTLRERFYTLRRFSKWCADQGAENPTDVDVGLMRSWGRQLASVGGARRLSPKAMAMKAANVAELLRDHLGCTQEVRAACLAISHRARKVGTLNRPTAATVALDEDLVLSYLSDAILVVTEDAQTVIALLRRWRRGRRLPGQSANECANWHVEHVGRRETFASKTLSRLGSGIAYSEENVVALVTGAAILTIALLSVMRSSELRQLTVGCVEKEPRGGSASWLVSGRLSKSKRPHRWVIVPEVKAAIELLEKIGCESRESTGTRALLAASLVSRRPYMPASTSGVAPSPAIVRRIREFAEACHPERARDAKLLSFRATRRFLARFLARRDRSTLGLLAMQYGHLNDQITDTYYVGSDRELARLLEKESEIELARAMDDLINATSVYTKLPLDVLEESKARMKGVLERAATEADVLRMLGAGVILGPCDWGYCFYREKRAKCGGNSGGPDAKNRTPTTCTGCLNFAATPTHRPWWKRRVDDLEQFCRLRGIPAQARLLAEDRLKKAREVLSAIEVLQ